MIIFFASINCCKSYKVNSSKFGTTNLIKHARDGRKNPNRQVDMKQKTITLRKECEGDLSVVRMKFVEFNQEQTPIACKDDNYR